VSMTDTIYSFIYIAVFIAGFLFITYEAGRDGVGLLKALDHNDYGPAILLLLIWPAAVAFALVAGLCWLLSFIFRWNGFIAIMPWRWAHWLGARRRRTEYGDETEAEEPSA